MAEANQVDLWYDKETAWGTKDTTPTLIELRFTRESFEGEKDTEESDEINESRMLEDIIETGQRARGGFEFELSYASYDDFFLGLLYDIAWSSAVTNTDTTYAAVASGNKFTDSGAQFVVDGFLSGQWVEVRGFTGAGTTANGYHKITALDASNMTVAGITLIDDSAGESVTITMQPQAINGTTESSFSFERQWTDLSTMFNTFAGMVVERMTLTVPNQGKVTGAFDFIGKVEATDTATFGDGSPTGANTNQIMSVGNHVKYVYMGYTAINVGAINLEFVNATREDRYVTSKYPAAIGKGGFRVNGTVQIFFTDHTHKTLFLNHTETSFAMVLEDSAGNGYIFDLPAVKITGCRTVAEDKDGLSLAEVSFTAYRDTTEDAMARIVKIPA